MIGSRCIRRVALAAALTSAIPVVVRAQERVWRPIARQCAMQLGEAIDNWPKWAACTVATVYGKQVSQAQFDACKDRVWSERRRANPCAQCGDPVKSVIECLGGE